MIKAGWQTDLEPVAIKHKCAVPYDNKTEQGNYPVGSIWICADCNDRWQYNGYKCDPFGYYASWTNLDNEARIKQATWEFKAYKKKYIWWYRFFIKKPDFEFQNFSVQKICTVLQ